MGIKGLSKFIRSKVPHAIRSVEMGHYFGKVIAVDASVVIYQFLTSARDTFSALTNDQGEETSHLAGVLYRTLKMLENGVKPIFVFDGEPPVEKQDELKKRDEQRQKVKDDLSVAKESGDMKTIEKLSRRTVKLSKSHIDSSKQLLELLGIPYVQAMCDAEAECALLVKQGIADAVATEDMDALTFGANILIRQFCAPASDKTKQMEEYDLDKIKDGLKISHDQFVDFCILLGCDFCETIKGIGPHSAYKNVLKHHNIEKMLSCLDKKKYHIPTNFNFQAARQVFTNPLKADLTNQLPFKWNKPNHDQLSDFLIKNNNFNENRVKSCMERLTKIAGSSKQSRLDSFFAVKRKVPTEDIKSKI